MIFSAVKKISPFFKRQSIYSAIILFFFIVFSLVAPTIGAQQHSILVKLQQPVLPLFKSNRNGQQNYASAVERVLGIHSIEKAMPVAGQMIAYLMETSEAGAEDIARWIKIDLPAGIDADSLLLALQSRPQVVYAQKNRVFHLDFVPNDPFVSQQWALGKIKAFDAWDIERGNKGVLVAVIDTGIDYLHHDLAGNIWINAGEDLNGNGQADDGDMNGIDDDGNGFVDDVQGWDFTDAPNYPHGQDYLVRDNDPMDESGHGTGVAGIIAAVTDNATGIAGMAPYARLMNLRAFTAGGNGEEDDVASAILYAIANGAKIINMSWGDVFVSRLLDDVIRYAEAHDIVMVASAGNAATDQIHYPSGFAGTISVGATDQKDNLAGFSNFGPTIDLVAPGVDIYTTTLEDKYTSYNGTSFSAPFVSGVAALLLSHFPDLSAAAIRSVLTRSANDVGNAGWDRYYGAGRLNARQALMQEAYSLIGITSPRLDDGFSGGPIVIKGSAWSPSLQSYSLAYGSGDNPTEWISIGEPSHTRVLDDTLALWQNLPQEEGSYMLRLLVENRDGTVEKDYVRIFIDKTPPVITNLQLLPMADGDRYSTLIQFTTDDLCEGSIFYRPWGSSQPFQEAVMSFRTHQLRLNMTSEMIEDRIEIKVQARNGAGLKTDDDNNGNYYQADLSRAPIDVAGFTASDLTLPSGYLLNRFADFNENGLPELIVSVDNGSAANIIHLYEFNGSAMNRVFSFDSQLIPRDVGDADGDGKPELLCGLGFSSYLYESPVKGAFPSVKVFTWQGDGSTQFWASRLADLDGDGVGEVVLRIVSSADGSPTDHYEIWENSGDNQYQTVASLKNPTSGSNQFGVPHVEIGDFDGDGNMEILFGDSDGDVYIYENRGDNLYVATWQDSLPLLDSIDYLSVGDYDGDGQLEFVAGSHSDPNLNTEHDYDARHWYYRVYDTVGDDQYDMVAEWRFFGFESPKDFPSGVSSGDVDGDGRDEILICVYPDFYIAEYNDENEYEIIYYHESIRSNTAIVTDADGDGNNEFWLGTETDTRAFIPVDGNISVPTPVGLKAQPVDEKQIILTWRRIPTADVYLIYRGTEQGNLDLLDRVKSEKYVDENVVMGQTYWYAVVAKDFEATPQESRRSVAVSARPGYRPYVVKAQMETLSSVRLRFSEPMDQSVKKASSYFINGGIGRPATVAYDASGQEVVLNLALPFTREGTYTVACSNVRDVDGTPIDTTRNIAGFRVQLPVSAPYLVEGRLVDSHLELLFSEAMDRLSAENPANYSLGDDIIIQSAVLSGEEKSHVVLQFEAKTAFGALGKSYTLRVKNLKSAKGVSIRPGRGDFIRLIFSKKSLDDVFTYPNPFRPGLGVETITFANLTEKAEILIMTPHGRKIRTLYEDNGDGGITWDLRDEDGNPVASGIYIYRVTSKNQSKLGKFAIIR